MSENNEKDRKPSEVKEQQSSYELIPERFEMIDGVRYDFLSSPKVHHQQILGELYAYFHHSCRERGVVLFAPMDVHFDDGNNIAQPDLIFIANENRKIIRDGFVFGVPDLLVEILSESTGRKDKTVKKLMYERFGVPEYWIVDPTHRTVDQFQIVDGKYHLLTTLSDEDVLHSPQFACVSIKLESIFTNKNDGSY